MKRRMTTMTATRDAMVPVTMPIIWPGERPGAVPGTAVVASGVGDSSAVVVVRGSVVNEVPEPVDELNTDGSSSVGISKVVSALVSLAVSGSDGVVESSSTNVTVGNAVSSSWVTVSVDQASSKDVCGARLIVEIKPKKLPVVDSSSLS
jgi:hypothetical protein